MCSFTVILPPYPFLELILFSTFRRVTRWHHLQDFAGVFCSLIPTFSKNLSLVLSGTWEQSVVRLPFLQVSTNKTVRTPRRRRSLLPQGRRRPTNCFRCHNPCCRRPELLKCSSVGPLLALLNKKILSLWLICISRTRSANQVTGIEPAHSPI